MILRPIMSIGAPDCASARCSMDAGCRREPDSSWICICTHDLSVPRPDGSCPRNVVTQHPYVVGSTKKTFIAIIRGGNDLPQLNATSGMNGSTGDSASTSSNLILMTWLLSMTGIVLTVIAVAVAVVLRRHQRSNGLPVPLSRHRLNRDRYATNSNYDEGRRASLGNDDGSKGDGLILLREWIEMKEEIGRGCFGQVYRGRFRRPGASSENPPLCDEIVAIKVLKATAGQEVERDLFREARIMAEFSHPNILAVRGIVINEGKVGPWLVFEYMSLGDLAQFLRTSTGLANHHPANSVKVPSTTLREPEMMSMAEQIASGMVYLSSQRFVHRDLACRNCLVHQAQKGPNGGVGLLVKISDFGMSRDVYTTDYYRMGGTQMLPVRWMSPESIIYGKFTSKSDVWSYGVVLWEIFSRGFQPYYGHSNEEVVKLVLDGVLLIPPECAPPLICRLFQECWKSLPADRPTFDEIHHDLVTEKLQTRRSFYKKQFSACSYISPTEVNEATAHTITQTFTIAVSNSVADDRLGYFTPLPDLSCKIGLAEVSQSTESIV